MAVSHSFTGEDIEDGSGEKADADRDHYDIEHGGYLEADFTAEGEQAGAGTASAGARIPESPQGCPGKPLRSQKEKNRRPNFVLAGLDPWAFSPRT
jgi:hypothetical protein